MLPWSPNCSASSVSAIPPKDGKAKGKFDFMDHWYPIQVKQVDKAGRPDIDSFEAVMMREDRSKGFFVSFDYTMDAEKEIRSFFLRTGKEIVPVKVSQILEGDVPIRLGGVVPDKTLGRQPERIFLCVGGVPDVEGGWVALAGFLLFLILTWCTVVL